MTSWCQQKSKYPMIVATANSLADLSGSHQLIGMVPLRSPESPARHHQTQCSQSRSPLQPCVGSEWQMGNRVCQPLVLCGFVLQSSCPWHVRFTNRFRWWCIIISWILILQCTQLRQRCRTDVVNTIGFVQMYHSPVLSHHNSKPILNKTTHTQDWRADRKQFERGSHIDFHTRHVHQLK